MILFLSSNAPPFLLLATTISSLLAGFSAPYLTYRPLLVILYALGPAIATFILLKKNTNMPFEKISIKWLIMSCALPIVYISTTYLLTTLTFAPQTTTTHSG